MTMIIDTNLLDSSIDMLCGAQSGFISGTLPDCKWNNKKEKLLKEYREFKSIAPDMLAALKLLRSMINEGGVPRYSITPGAALNSFVEEDLDPIIAKAEGG